MYKTVIVFLVSVWLTAISCGDTQEKTTPLNTQKTEPNAEQDSGKDVSSSHRIPNPTGWVNDFAYLFSTAEEKYFDSLLSRYEKETGNEIAIVTIPDSWTTVEKFDSLTVAIHNQWGVGKKEKNNGIVIGISPTFRKIRISNGHGIEAMLTDEETKNILESIIIPEYKQDNYFEGTKKGILAIQAELR